MSNPGPNEEIYLSIVVPCFNEADNVANTARVVEDVFRPLGKPFEIIFVNDGSLDDTQRKVDGLAAGDPCVVAAGYPVNAGRGKAIRTGMGAARGRFVASIDADLSYHPSFILEMLKTLEAHPEADFVIGSEFMPGGSTEGVPPLRLFISKAANIILRRLLPGGFHKCTGVFRCYRRSMLEKLVLESDGKELHLEIIAKAMVLGFNGIEVPVVLRARKRGKSKTHFAKTAISHSVYGLHEKPMLVFGLGGLVMLAAAIILGVYLFILSATGHPVAGRPLLLFAVFLGITAMLIIAMGFIAIQNVALRNELYKLSSRLKQMSDRMADTKNVD